MFTFDQPTEYELTLAAQQLLFDTIQQAEKFPRMGESDEQATKRLKKTWHTMITGVHESLRQITGARMFLPNDTIADALAEGANPQAIDAAELIHYLPTIGASVQDGPIAVFDLLTLLVRVGYRMRGAEIDGITHAFKQRIAIHITGSEWLSAGCPAMTLHVGH